MLSTRQFIGAATTALSLITGALLLALAAGNARAQGPAPTCWGVSVACQEPAAGALISVNQKYGGPPWRSREVAATLPSGPVNESSPSSGFSVTSMTCSGAPFHGAHGEGRSAISPAASQVGAEPCAWAFPAARARRNSPVISDNAVVAAPMNWRAERTGNSLPLSRSATQLAENHGKSRSARMHPSVATGQSAGARVRPLHPRKRTCASCLEMSGLCQKRTYAPQQIASLFDHLVGSAHRPEALTCVNR